MPFVVATSQVVSGTAYALAAGDRFLVPASVYLAQTTFTTALVTMSGTTQSTIAGQLFAYAGRGMLATSGSTDVQITSGGSVSANIAIEAGGTSLVVRNSGTVTTGDASLGGSGYALRSTADYTTINNDGVISTTIIDSYGISVSGSAQIGNAGSITTINGYGISANALRLTNSGSIMTQNGVESAIIVGSGLMDLYNTGSIVGQVFNPAPYPSYALASGSGDALIFNAGRIIGRISLQEGASTITNLGVISGDVTAGSGIDVIINSGELTGLVNLGGGANRLENAGLIVGSVTTLAGADIFQNAGVVQGSINSGDGVDSIDNAYGMITGNIVAGLGDDTVTGGAQRDVIYGDNISGDTTGGNDILAGNYGDDLIYGGYGNDQLYGNQGDDVLYGNQEDDWMHGGQGNDVLFGGQGNDTLNGGVGDDVLYGNLGDDAFVFSGPGFGHDVIGDFGAGADRIQFGAGVFADFADLQAHARDLNGGVLITDATGDTLFLVGAITSGLSAAQFVIG